jgi:hypothetical protein
MVSPAHRIGFGARPDNQYKVRYTGSLMGFYLIRILPLCLIFVVIAGLYIDDDMRRQIFSRHTTRYKPFSWFEFSVLLALVMAPLADLMLTLRRVEPGHIALSLSRDGISGAVFHMTRLIPWDEIADVTVKGAFLVVRRQPRSVFHSFLARHSFGEMRIPTHQLDRDVDDILAAVRRFSPTTDRHAAVS